MEYFAGLDVSMEETHICVVDRGGKVILEARTSTAPKTIASVSAKGPAGDRVLFETGRMAPTGSVKLTNLGRSKPSGMLDYAATTTSRHVCMADARKARCVLAEVRWRWTLKML